MKRLLFCVCGLWLGTNYAQLSLVVYAQQKVLTTGMERRVNEIKIDSVVFKVKPEPRKKIEKVVVLIIGSNGEAVHTYNNHGPWLYNRLLAELKKHVNGKLHIPHYETWDGHKHTCNYTLLLKP